MKFKKNVSTSDYGFLYGFGLFETFYVTKEYSIILFDEHIERIYNSLSYFKIDWTIEKEDFKKHLFKHIKKNNYNDMVVRVTISAGNLTGGIKPSVFVHTREYLKNDDLYSKGSRLLVSSIRVNEYSMLARHKTCNYLENFIESRKAASKGYFDTIILNSKEHIAETTKCNVFFVKDKIIYTPDEDCGILPGIMRKWTIEKLEKFKIDFKKGNFNINKLINADEVFITNSVVGILPVACIEKKRISNCPGEVTCLLMREFKKINK
mgnify:CR=1 FL=1